MNPRHEPYPEVQLPPIIPPHTEEYVRSFADSFEKDGIVPKLYNDWEIVTWTGPVGYDGHIAAEGFTKSFKRKQFPAAPDSHDPIHFPFAIEITRDPDVATLFASSAAYALKEPIPNYTKGWMPEMFTRNVAQLEDSVLLMAYMRAGRELPPTAHPGSDPREFYRKRGQNALEWITYFGVVGHENVKGQTLDEVTGKYSPKNLSLLNRQTAYRLGLSDPSDDPYALFST